MLVCHIKVYHLLICGFHENANNIRQLYLNFKYFIYYHSWTADVIIYLKPHRWFLCNVLALTAGGLGLDPQNTKKNQSKYFKIGSRCFSNNQMAFRDWFDRSQNKYPSALTCLFAGCCFCKHPSRRVKREH